MRSLIRGQTSVEVLLVISFVLLLVLGIILPYVENQNITNAALTAKLSILPYVEKNSLRAKIVSIDPEVNGSEITLHIATTAAWDTLVYDELMYGSPVSGCVNVCNHVYALGTYSRVYIDWVDSGLPFCSGIFYCDATTVNASPSSYVDEDVLQVDPLTHTLPSSFQLPSNSSASVTIPIQNRVVGDSSYSEISTVLVSVICRYTYQGDPCSIITPDAQGYSNFVAQLAAGSNVSTLIPSTLRVTQYGSTPGDAIIPQLYTQLYSQLNGSPTSCDAVLCPIVATDIDAGPNPVVSNYTIDPSLMSLPQGAYRFISFIHKAHFDYSSSVPPVYNREERPSFQGNNLQIIDFSVV